MKISYVLPNDILTNEELEKNYSSLSWTAAKIYRKTGIKSRHIAVKERASDLAREAAETLFAEYDISPSAIDFILLCTQSADYYLPSTACILQHQLGIPISAGAFDFDLGCSGYIYGLAVAKGLLSSGIAKNILLITSETYSKYINPLDRSTRTVFGDGAAATYLSSGDVNKIGKFILGTDGRGAENLIVPAGAAALKCSKETLAENEDSSGNIRNKNNIFMNGPEIFAFTLRTVPKLISDILTINAVPSIDDIDYVVLHQANKLVLRTLQEKLKIPDDKFCIDVEEIGNTVSSTIPIAIKRALTSPHKSSMLKIGAKVLVAGFGVGYSWGGTIITL